MLQIRLDYGLKMAVEGQTRAKSDVLKDKELRLLAELMRNSRRSDRSIENRLGALRFNGFLDSMSMEFLVVAFESDSCFVKVDHHCSYVPFLNAFSSSVSEEPHCPIRPNKSVSDVLINGCSSLNHISKPETSCVSRSNIWNVRCSMR